MHLATVTLWPLATNGTQKHYKIKVESRMCVRERGKKGNQSHSDNEGIFQSKPKTSEPVKWHAYLLCGQIVVAVVSPV